MKNPHDQYESISFSPGWVRTVSVGYPVKAALFTCTTVINIQKVPAELIPDFPVSGYGGKIGR